MGSERATMALNASMSAPAIAGAEPAEPEISERARNTAREIMAMADRHARNGQLTILELDTFLTQTQHESFLKCAPDLA